MWISFRKQKGGACSLVVHGTPTARSSATPTVSPAVVRGETIPQQDPIQFIPGEELPTPTATPLPELAIPNVKGVRLGASYSFSHATWLCNGDFECARRMLEDTACGLKVDSLRLMAPWDWLQDDSSSSLKTDFNVDWQLAIVKR